jgi:hypothetical protein
MSPRCTASCGLVADATMVRGPGTALGKFVDELAGQMWRVAAPESRHGSPGRHVESRLEFA